MSRFPWHMRRQLEDAAKVAAIVADVEALPEGDSVVAGGTAAGDARRLRGIPAIGRGVAGAIGGSDPLRAVLEMELRRRR